MYSKRTVSYSYTGFSMAPKVQSLKAGDVVEVATWRFGEEYARANGASDVDWEFDVTTSVSSLISTCLLYTSPSPRDRTRSRMPSSA